MDSIRTWRGLQIWTSACKQPGLINSRGRGRVGEDFAQFQQAVDSLKTDSDLQHYTSSVNENVKRF